MIDVEYEIRNKSHIYNINKLMKKYKNGLDNISTKFLHPKMVFLDFEYSNICKAYFDNPDYIGGIYWAKGSYMGAESCADGSYTSNSAKIWINTTHHSNVLKTCYHELGHHFYNTILSDTDRAKWLDYHCQNMKILNFAKISKKFKKLTGIDIKTDEKSVINCYEILKADKKLSILLNIIYVCFSELKNKGYIKYFCKNEWINGPRNEEENFCDAFACFILNRNIYESNKIFFKKLLSNLRLS